MNKIYALISMLFLIVLAGCLTIPEPVSVRSEPVMAAYTPKFEVESLRFFTADEKGIEKAYRIYNTSFRPEAVDRIWYELIVRSLTEKDSKVIYREVWYDGENRVLSSVIKEMNLRSGDKFLEYTAGIKTEWTKGYYVLKLFQDSLEVANREFKIID